MGIDPIKSANSGIANMGQAVRRDTAAKETADIMLKEPETPAAVFERSGPADQTVLSTYNRAALSANAVPSKETAKYAGLSRLLESLFGLQAAQGKKAEGQPGKTTAAEQHDGNLKDYIAGLEVDGATRLEAQHAIAEDGYWGVEQTSQRIIQFAISLSGGDTSKLETLKNAILKGFEEAERSWGGALPDICQRTKAAALKGLEEWAAPQVQDVTAN